MNKKIFGNVNFKEIPNVMDLLVAAEKYESLIFVQADNQTVKGKRVKFIRYTYGGNTCTIAVTNKEFLKIDTDGKVSKKMCDYDAPYNRPSYYSNKVYLFASEHDRREYYKYTGTSDFQDAFLNIIASAKKEQEKLNEKRRIARRKRKEAKDKEQFHSKLGRKPRLNPDDYLPQYIYFNGDNNICTKCGNEVEVPVKKHNKIVKCPVCGSEVKLINKKIRKKPIEDHEWVVVPEILDGDYNCLRYFLAERSKSGEVCINEMARAFFSETFEKPRYFEMVYDYDTKKYYWKESYRYYFSDVGFMGRRNSYFNGYAVPYKGMAEFVGRYYKYFPSDSKFFKEKGAFWVGFMTDTKTKAATYEVLLKNGYIKVADEYSGWGYYTMRNINYNGKNIPEIFDISRYDVKLLGEDPYYKDIKELKKLNMANITYKSKEDERIRETFGELLNISDSELEFLSSKTFAKCRYIKEQSYGDKREFLSEYMHYLSIAKRLGYEMNKIVLFPKDFRKADMKMSAEYKILMDKLEEETRKKLNKTFGNTVNNIKKAMMNSDVIKEFMTGSKGLLVKVPETPEELEQEHKALANCLHTYKEKMAKGESTIFFIRRVEEPDKAYFAMEYMDGKIKQVHGYANCNATPEVKQFAEKFAEVLRIIKFNALACATAAA